jgi:Cu-processing system ATP-binding protein
LDRVRVIAPTATAEGDELLIPGPPAARPAALDVIRAAGCDIRGLTAEEGRLDTLYRELVGEIP